MKLTEFSVQGFKSIEKTKLDRIGFFTTLVGKNNSGKSNMLDAIQYFFSDMIPSLAKKSALSPYALRRVGMQTASKVKFHVTIELEEFELSEYVRNHQEAGHILNIIGNGPYIVE
ncbi:MAG: AAA family ATPase, partial [Candidatus Thorarchaeota archaeon]